MIKIRIHVLEAAPAGFNMHECCWKKVVAECVAFNVIQDAPFFNVPCKSFVNTSPVRCPLLRMRGVGLMG